MQGWISIHRKILENPILTTNTSYSKREAFIYLLLKANHKDNKVVIGSTLYNVKQGELITSQKKLCKKFKWGNTKLRNFLKLLENDNMIKLKTEVNLTQISICNYRSYQDSQTGNKSLPNRSQIAAKSQTNTNNNVNKTNNVNNVNIRKQKFTNEVLAEGLKHTPMVEPTICDDFIDYWTEFNKSKTKMKFELQQTFDISRRLKRWLKNDFNKTNKKVSENWKLDSTGKFIIGYCECGKSDFYDQYMINKQDTKCCGKKINHDRIKTNININKEIKTEQWKN